MGKTTLGLELMRWRDRPVCCEFEVSRECPELAGKGLSLVGPNSTPMRITKLCALFVRLTAPAPMALGIQGLRDLRIVTAFAGTAEAKWPSRICAATNSPVALAAHPERNDVEVDTGLEQMPRGDVAAPRK
jgi:hypothetical protein